MPSSLRKQKGGLPASNVEKPLPDSVRLKLTVAFDGTAYAGWQTQATGVAVQEVIEMALTKIFPGKHHLHSSSRTDSGVHARAMVAHLELPKAVFRMLPSKLALALNAHLPEDIRIMEVRKVPPYFHARFHASGKEYRYYVWNHPAMDPLRRTQAWHVPQTLDFPAMREAARLLVGTHDFRSFATHHTYHIEDTVRTLSRVELRKQGPLITIIIEGDGFLYKMCRGIAGTLVQVGRGRFSPQQMKTMLDAIDRRVAGMSAPAAGLVLWKVLYPSLAVIQKRASSSESSEVLPENVE